MTQKQPYTEDIPLFISRSSMSTEINKTGSWRFARPKYNEKTAPCSEACPLGEDIARIEMLAHKGLLNEAIELILMENPFPSVCGRVCFHPCETACNRSDFDGPVAVHQLERYLGDAFIQEKMPMSMKKRPANGKRCVLSVRVRRVWLRDTFLNVWAMRVISLRPGPNPVGFFDGEYPNIDCRAIFYPMK